MHWSDKHPERPAEDLPEPDGLNEGGGDVPPPEDDPAADRPLMTGPPPAEADSDFRSLPPAMMDRPPQDTPLPEAVATAGDSEDSADDTNNNPGETTPDTAATETGNGNDGGGDNPPPALAGEGDERGELRRIRTACLEEAEELYTQMMRDPLDPKNDFFSDPSASDKALVVLAQASVDTEDGAAKIAEYADRLGAGRETEVANVVAMDLAQINGGDAEAARNTYLRLRTKVSQERARGDSPVLLRAIVEECEHRELPAEDWIKASSDPAVQREVSIEHYARVLEHQKGIYADITQPQATELVRDIVRKPPYEGFLKDVPRLLKIADDQQLKDALIAKGSTAVYSMPYEAENLRDAFAMGKAALEDADVEGTTLNTISAAVTYGLVKLRSEEELPPTIREIDTNDRFGLYQAGVECVVSFAVRRGAPSQEAIDTAHKLVAKYAPYTDKTGIIAQTAATFLVTDKPEEARRVVRSLITPEAQQRALERCWENAKTIEQLDQISPSVATRPVDHAAEEVYRRARARVADDPEEVARYITWQIDHAPEAPSWGARIMQAGQSFDKLITLDPRRAEEVACDALRRIHGSRPQVHIGLLQPFYDVLTRIGTPTSLRAARNSIDNAKGGYTSKMSALASIARPVQRL